MGCNVTVFMHEDYFDAVLELINRGYQDYKKKEKGTELYEEVLTAYQNAITHFKECTKLTDVWTEEDRTAEDIDGRLTWPKL